MVDDEIIKEVRRTRDELAARFDYDLDAICAHYQKMQQERGIQTVTLPPRKPVDTRLGVRAHAQNGNGAKPQPQSGNAQGLVSITEEVEEPLADFEEYTQ